MRRLTTSTILAKLVVLLYVAIQVDSIGHGSKKLLALPIWNLSMTDCSLFRNETALRPMFEIWPEDIPNVPFRYCCEYQPNENVQSTFELSNYTYGPDSGILRTSPYYDIGILEANNFGYYLTHWTYWGLSLKKSRTSMLHCDMTDLQRLYIYRLWSKALVKGSITWASTFGLCGILVLLSLFLGKSTFKCGVYGPMKVKPIMDKENVRKVIKQMSMLIKNQCSTSLKLEVTKPQIYESEILEVGETMETFEQESIQPKRITHMEYVKMVLEEGHKICDPEDEDCNPTVDKEELFSDACHILLLSLVGSCLIEGITHSPLHTWRSQLMFNASVTYAYLTLFATISTIIRHCAFLDLRHQPDWRWQKVFGQLAAQFMMGTYLVLVDDKSEHSLDPFAGPVLGACVAASVWSGGVEMVIIVRYIWLKIIKKYFWNKCIEKCLLGCLWTKSPVLKQTTTLWKGLTCGCKRK